MDSFIEGFLHAFKTITLVKVSDSNLRLIGEIVGEMFLCLTTMLIISALIYCCIYWVNKLKKYTFMFYRGTYGGCHFIPYIYWTKEYKEIGWIVWVLTIDLNTK